MRRTLSSLRGLLLVGLLACAALPAFAQDPPPEKPDAPAEKADALVDPVELANELRPSPVRDEVLQRLGEVDALRELATSEMEALTKQKSALEAALTDRENDFRTYKADYDGDEDVQPDLDVVAEKLRSLEAGLDEVTAEKERTAELRARLVSARQRADGSKDDLDTTYADWLSRAREAVEGDPWTDADTQAWSALQNAHEAALSRVVADLDRAIDLISEVRAVRDRVRKQEEATIRLLRRENLLLRGKSDITVDAVAAGVRDLGELPGWAVSTGRRVVRAVTSGAHTGDVVRWAGVSLLLMVGLGLLRRRIRKRYRDPAELTSDVERSKDLLWRLLGPATWAALISVPFLLAAELLDALPQGWRNTFHAVGLTIGVLWIARAVMRRLLPSEDAWSPIELDGRTRMLVRTGVVLILWLSAVLVPIGIALYELGYDNPGARQALWTLYKLLTVVVLLLFVLRRAVVLSFLPSESKAIGRVLRSVVSAVHPLMMLVGPFLLALDFLQYDVLAEFLLRLIGGVALAAASAFFVFGALWRGLSAWIRSAVSEPPDSTPEASTVEAAVVIARYVLLVGVLVGAFFVMLAVQGGDLTAVHDILDVELPFQGQFEGKHITWFNVLAGLALTTLFLTAVPKLKLAVERFVLPRTSLDSGLRYTISTLVGYTFAALGIYIGLVQIFDLGAIGYVFAALSVGIGFGLQEIVSNFVSGLILLFERPIKVGDLITVGDTEGWVTKINIRATTIQTRDNISMLIPNKDFITQAVVNSVYGDSIVRIHVNVGVAYGSDTELVKKLMLQAAKEHSQVLENRRTEVAFRDFGGSSLDFALLCWIPEASEHMRVTSDLRFAIDRLFRENDIEIPFSQHDLHLRSVDDEAAQKLRGPRPATDDPAG